MIVLGILGLGCSLALGLAAIIVTFAPKPARWYAKVPLVIMLLALSFAAYLVFDPMVQEALR